jgi:hypothetical protein
MCVCIGGYVQNEEHELGELDILLLNNLTRLEEGSRQLLQVGESLEGFYLEKLVELLVSKRGDEKKDPYAWIARVLMNVSQLPEARKILLDEKRDIFKDLLKDIQHRNPIRKRAILGAIKYNHPPYSDCRSRVYEHGFDPWCAETAASSRGSTTGCWPRTK